ncbi:MULTISPECIES: hypothetical protein [Caulobacter]|uniref:SMODS and SLOG-associating 2TM effector domain-containing protein n=1 Tax=Caulobacter vibrioides OR37 TaxID=1292034 RepID=R0D3D6_CAUVI|nr:MULTISPECIES: hypothetical protein [Caulobacter]ENZ83126.1 hypothetical protein OR37_00900 [Caulobacter vibrioides OR37]MBQ1561833.1 hypothetical protein [Caulobacter sp.]
MKINQIPDLYWAQLRQVKAGAIYSRLYRNRLSRRIKAVELIKAAGSSGAIAGWVIWKDLPLLWSGIIAGAQLLDALKGVFPFAKLHRAASDLTVAMETIWIDADAEWTDIYAGRLTDQDITKRLQKLRKLVLQAENKHFPDGFEYEAKLAALAEQETKSYFRITYESEVKP